MFRGIVAKFATTQLTAVSRSRLRWRTSSTYPAVVEGTQQENNQTERPTTAFPTQPREPYWIKNTLDRSICYAKDFQTLLQLIHEGQYLTGSNASNLMITFSRLIREGQMEVQDFQKFEGKKKIEKALLKGDLKIGVIQILETLKSALKLGFPSGSELVSILENEVIWVLRRTSIKQHFFVIDVFTSSQLVDSEGVPFQSMQKDRILKEVSESIQRRWIELTEASDFEQFFRHSTLFPPKFIDKIEDMLVGLIESFTPDDISKLFSALGASQRRTVPVLRALSYHLIKNTDPLSPQSSADILSAVQRLSFHDPALLDRVCNDLVVNLRTQAKPALLRIILLAIGQLKFRHEGVLEAISSWMNLHWDQIRKKDVVALLLSLASVDFTPSCWKSLWPNIADVLKEEFETPTLNEHILLDVTWSLAVLGQLNSETVRFTLNDTFLSKLLKNQTGTNIFRLTGGKLKLNQLWALACLNKWELNDFTVKMPLTVESQRASRASTEKSKTCSTVSQSVMSVLANFIPAGKYLRQDVQTPFGVRMEGECILNNQCVPLALADYDRGEVLPAKTARIAVMVLDYKDLCLGQPHLTGPQALRQRLLQMSGYHTVTVKHTDLNADDTLVAQVQFLEQLIKTTVLSKL